MEINIGNKIRELRKKKGITQEQLASALGITSQAVSKWEMNTGYPDVTMLPIIAGYFGVSMDMLFNYDADKLEENIMNVLYSSRGGKPFEEAEKNSASRNRRLSNRIYSQARTAGVVRRRDQGTW